MFKIQMLSNKLWYVQHEASRRFYFERYTQESDAKICLGHLKELNPDQLTRTLANDFVLKTSYCSTVYGYVGESNKELTITNDKDNYWLIEHEETRMFFIFKYADADKAQTCANNMNNLWDTDPKAKIRAFNDGYFTFDKDNIRERPKF